jgi:integrase
MTTPIDSGSKKNLGDSVGTGKQPRERWLGGYIRNGVFVIERKIGGRKFHVSTHATTERGALKQLERFEADPVGYDPNARAGSALVLNEALIDRFHAWQLEGVSRQWALNVRNVLVDWANHLKGADLRRLSLVNDLKPHLRGKGQQHHRVKAIRSLFAWLRGELGLITRAEDVTLDFVVPTVKARQETGESKAVPFDNVVAVANHLPVHVRDVLELLAATGWHVNEVRRFAKAGSIREKDVSDSAETVAVIGTAHKSGRKHFTALVSPEPLAAARRIRERGHVIDNNRLAKHMRRACAAAKVPVFQLGAMRHSVATWLRQRGVPDAQISAFLGHRSVSTTLRHYIDHQVAALVLPRTALRVVS